MTDPDPYTDLGGQPSPATVPTTLRGCGQHPCLGHAPDGHVCPWVDTDDGITACGCTHRPAEKGTRR